MLSRLSRVSGWNFDGPPTLSEGSRPACTAIVAFVAGGVVGGLVTGGPVAVEVMVVDGARGIGGSIDTPGSGGVSSPVNQPGPDPR